MDAPGELARKYQMLTGHLDERALRLCLGADALSLGHGGASIVAKAAGVSRTTVHAGMTALRGEGAGELTATASNRARVRRPGGGRKPLKDKDSQLVSDLDKLLDPVTRGDPMAPLRWTAKSTTKLAEELQVKGHEVSQATVWRLLDGLGYSMQSNRKTREGTDHPDRNAQFEFIGSTVKDFLERGQPVISVDTKKKELIGPYKNGGREWEKKEKPVEVNMHDFPDPELGKAIPYGVYDIGRNEGWVSVGVTHDTSEFAVATIRRWWLKMGRLVYPAARELLITADGGGSNGARVRLWKQELQRLADDLGMPIHIRHFPPGTSKWNKIEHRMFCHITENWRAQPLTSVMTVVNLIGNTCTKTGLSIQSELDANHYETGQKVADDVMNALAITCCGFHGEWNYQIDPKSPEP
ncbi:MAG: ISAzo13 family transposase [Alphaproteobacteria bacterium]|nr:ISAzo13 family transposase [Alphaproteobacteria bacterium]